MIFGEIIREKIVKFDEEMSTIIQNRWRPPFPSLVTAEMHLIGRTPDPAARQPGRNCSAGQTALFRRAKRRMGTVCMTVRDVIWPGTGTSGELCLPLHENGGFHAVGSQL